MHLSVLIKLLQSIKKTKGDLRVGSNSCSPGYDGPVAVLSTHSEIGLAHASASEVLPKAPDEEPWGDINTSLNYLDTLLNTSAAQVQESIKQVEEMIKRYTKVN